jgi:3-methylfumaryl-CoA hydratase
MGMSTPLADKPTATPFDAWVGREETLHARLLPESVQALAATLDWPEAPSEGDALPPGWQWMFFNPVMRASGLGEDGHPKRGGFVSPHAPRGGSAGLGRPGAGFLPPIELPRRMWAGSRLRYLAPLRVGDTAERHSRISKIEHKSGKRGELWFVTVEHTTRSQGRDCIVEQQDIVYREAATPGTAPSPTPPRHEAQAQWVQSVMPGTTLLFRYSALTFNGHRIHYDADYAREVEGYPALVVHGPLTATLLQQFVLQQCPGRRLAGFEFRGVSPLHVDRTFTLEGALQGDDAAELWARGPDGELAMAARATLAPASN